MGLAPEHYHVWQPKEEIELFKKLWEEGVLIHKIIERFNARPSRAKRRMTAYELFNLREALKLQPRGNPRTKDFESIEDYYASESPLGRLPEPDRIAEAFGSCRFEDAAVKEPAGRVHLTQTYVRSASHSSTCMETSDW